VNAFGYSWTDGTPTPTATNTPTGVYVLGLNNGFQITAPADTTSRALTVYVDTFNAQGQIVAHLSDSSASDYVDSSLNGAGGGTAQGAYTFTYKAASSGQTLTVTFTNIADNGAGSNVALEAATLVAANPNFSLTAGPSTVSIGIAGTAHYTTTVSAQFGFSGNVSFAVTGLPTGATASFNPPTVTGSGSSVMTVTTTSSTPVGTYSLTITGTSGALSQSSQVSLTTSNVTPAFTLSPTPGTATVSAGQSANYTVMITPQTAFTSPVSLSCSGLPSGAACSFNPPSVTLNGSQTKSLLTITTSGTVALRVSPFARHSLLATGFLVLPAGIVLASVLPRARRRKLWWTGYSAILLSVLLLGGCGGGSSTSGGGGGGGGTPTGNYTVTITGTASGVSETVNVNLVVQ
jgi:hypothetical protein